MEIERKFLIEQLPEDLEQYPCCRIQQAYLSTAPVIRVRRSDEQYLLTCKGKGLLAREEHEMALSAEEYRSLLARAQGAVISKTRYLIPFDGYTIELDVFDAPLQPLVLAEVEFSTEEEAYDFCPPAWFGRDVTEKPAFTNAALSKAGVEQQEVRPGRYRHFKGNEYQVLYTAVHSETEESMVVYRALYGEGSVWVRPVSMWNEAVKRDGKEFRRFTYLGE